VASRNSKRNQLTAWVTENRPAIIDPPVLERIAAALAPVSARYLRDLVRDSGVPLHPLVEGVRQDTFEHLADTLTRLSEVYESARATPDRATQSACRGLVIEAKDHARWSLRRLGDSQDEQKVKTEMIEWMIVWLENPEIFPVWARLRLAARDERGSGR
jgi:hypothetical protein